MFKVLLVEDEMPVRDRIVKLIDWHNLGLEMTFVAGDGQEAFNFLEDNDVDLILTDICMPFMDGIELSKKVREKNDYCKIIFLTGYDNFQYAKDAIELDVHRYLQKPINKVELETVLKKVVQDLEADIEKERAYFELKSEYQKQLVSFQDRLILDVLYKKIDQEPAEAFDSMNICFEGDYFRIAVLKIVPQSQVLEDYSMLNYSIFSYFKKRMESSLNHRCIFGDQSRIIVILTGQNEKNLEDEAFSILNKTLHNAKHVFNASFSAGLSSSYRHISEIKHAFDGAVNASQYAVVEGYDKLILSTDMEPIAPMYLDRLDKIRLDLSDCIKLQDNQKIAEKMKAYFDTLRFCKCSLDEVKSQLVLLTMEIYKTYNNTCGSLEQKEEVDYILMNDIFKLNDIRDIEQKIYDLMVSMTSKLKRMRDSFKTNIVERALVIIHKEYMHSSLDSKSISQELNVSASYFSRLFKQMTSKTFVEYLTEYRMNAAKKLLKTSDMKVYEISVTIGYDDPQYFSYNFRKHIGMTPSAYRKKGK